MELNQIIIDDFLADPMAIRNQALAMAYPPRPEQASYPGRNAGKQIALPGLEQLISSIVHQHLGPASNSSHCTPRISLAGDERKAAVHADFNQWSAIVYLSLDEHAQGGTHFYRHKATGWDRAPVYPGEPESKGYANADAAMRDILGKGSNDRSHWEETQIIPMKFNRLALFRGYFWHDAGESFGDTPENGRLILPFFFDAAAPPGR
jgi:hypothetical protein